MPCPLNRTIAWYSSRTSWVANTVQAGQALAVSSAGAK